MIQQRDDDGSPPSDITRLARDGRLPPEPDPDATVATNPTLLTSPGPGGEATRASTPSPSQPPAVPALALSAGYRLHEYRIDAVLGQGGFGITYLASDVNLHAKVAIKEYLPEQFAFRAADITVSPRSAELAETYEKGLESYLVEARTLATFRHPHIVRVARFFEANNTAYMVLEYERGESMKAWWRKHSELPEAELLLLFGPLLDGLSVVHEAGFLHRDIKPDNIYVRDGDGSLVLLDFGAARRTSEEQSEASNFVTPGYGPIEQYVLGEQGPWTDIYALGATLYWMVSGRKPIAAPERMVAVDPLRPAVEVGAGRYSAEFLKAIDWALKPETQERPKDVAAIRAALFAGHPASLDLQAALRAGDREVVGGGEGWAAALRSPRLARAKLGRAAGALARPGSWPLAVKMTLAMVFAALVPMLVTAYYNYTGSVARVSAGELRNLEQLAGSVAGRVSQLISDSRNLAVYVGNDKEFVAFLGNPTEASKRDILLKLRSLVKANSDLDVVTVLDAGGTALTSTNATVPGGNFKFRRYFQEAAAGRPYVTGIIVGATAGDPGVFFSHPVRDEDGRVLGVVTLRIKGSAIAAILEEARGITRRTALLVDGDGILIHHSDPWLTYRSLTTLAPEKVAEIVADQRFRTNSIESVGLSELAAAMVGAKAQGNASYRSPVTGTAEIAGYAPVTGQDWVVGMSETRDVFEAPLHELFRTVLYSVGVVGLLFLVLAVWFARTIVRPIEGLTAAAHALKSADYDKASVRVTSTDEIGQFARVFNVMIDVLRQRERELGDRNRRRERGSKPDAG